MKYIYHINSTSFLILFLCATVFYSCKKETSEEIQLFAATGSMLSASEICTSYQRNKQIVIEKNFAASGVLARQIKAGADAHIFISANKQWIDYLNENQLIIENTISTLAQNKLVIVCPKNKDINIDLREDFDIKSAIKNNICIGDPKYVPVGAYAKQVLDSLNWYSQIQNDIILAKDVSSVLHYVELEECDWGIVYYSEAIKSNKVKIVYEIPHEFYTPINFYIALLKENEKSRELYQYFIGDSAKEIFNKYGFTTNSL